MIKMDFNEELQNIYSIKLNNNIKDYNIKKLLVDKD